MTPWDLVWWSLAGTFAAFMELGFLSVVVIAVGFGVATVTDWASKRRALAGKEKNE